MTADLAEVERRTLLLRIAELEELEDRADREAMLKGQIEASRAQNERDRESIKANAFKVIDEYDRTTVAPLVRQLKQACVEMRVAADILGRGRNKSEAEGLRHRAAKIEAMLKGNR